MKLNNLFILSVLVIVAACSGQPEETTPKPEIEAEVQANEAVESDKTTPGLLDLGDRLPAQLKDQNVVFEDFKDKFLTRLWQLYPGDALYQGYYLHDEKLMIPNGETRALRRSFFVSELQILKQFNANFLTPANATDLAIISNQIRSYLWYIDEFREYEWNPALYNPAGEFALILNTDYKPLIERAETLSSRLESLPAYYDAAKRTIKVPTLQHLSLAIQQSKGALGLYQKTIPDRFAEVDLTEPLRASLDSNLSSARSAVEDYVAWMEELEAGLDETTARSFRIGQELYEKKFKHDIVSGYSAKELYDRALIAKDKLHSEMISITEQLWPEYFPQQDLPENSLVAVKQMIDKLSSKHIEREKFVDEIRRQMPIIQKFMDDNELLDSDPSRPLVVRLTPEYERGFAGASVDAPGPYNATANTYYNVSPLDDFTPEQAESYLREYNHWILQILNIHEATPGHYTQLMHANKTPSKIKAVFGNGAMIEGWAVYSERMMLEEGYGNDEPEMWLMYSKWNLRVVVNTILDYSVHVLGMRRDQALDLLINEAFQEQAEAEGKWRRATISQVQLTSYFNGYSEIYEFREELKQKMGDDFNLRDFHNKFLSYGSAPVPVIRTLMLDELGLSREPLSAPPEEEASNEASNDQVSEAGVSETGVEETRVEETRIAEDQVVDEGGESE